MVQMVEAMEGMLEHKLQLKRLFYSNNKISH